MKKTDDFWVGDRLVRPSLGEIRLGPERVHLEPRSMEVLLALARSPSRVIPKQELIEAVWGDAFVSDEVLTHAIWDLRRAFGDRASDPEFIQTVPKKGYRLIAPVKALGRPRRRATDRQPAAAQQTSRPPARRTPIRIPLAVAAVLVAGYWGVRQWIPGGATPRADPGTVLRLILDHSDGPANWGQRLEVGLARELAGPDLEVVSTDSCTEGPAPSADYCLEAQLLHGAGGYQVIAQLLKAAGGGLAYSAAGQVQNTGEDLDGVAAELGERVHIYLQVTKDPHFGDPDLEPWISFQNHDIRAVRDFLLGVAYVYRNEVGGRVAMTNAMRYDTGFVAPRVWRTPSLVSEGETAALAKHRAELERLYPDADAFEKAMIMWARAVIDADPAKQIQQLRVALQRAPENRPIRFVLGATLADQGDLEEAWRQVEPLVAQNWHYPGLYPVAAIVAIQRDRIDDIRRALDLALKVGTVDPEALAVLVALAIYDEDSRKEGLFSKRLDLRRREMTSEEVDNEYVSVVASSLGDRAEAEGREEIAARLRESAY